MIDVEIAHKKVMAWNAKEYQTRLFRRKHLYPGHLTVLQQGKMAAFYRFLSL